ncbi:unnamed protein product [Adineta steineri]|uniref:ABC-2 type transporter transmembrane domain-containing protein n=1 Tax=Adineta steineri TaxID=433720 RepID=A0A819FK78_9BILA|nr:unnamed protein product [Adineta steineri]CAF1316840.1 unnamed protein product [Adineta steineri]CAF3707427.1 unnamed protein product [Adineta steineri]CAF3869990.1 unnamed protein product [Adineta steineri]
MISDKSNDDGVAVNFTNKHPEFTFNWSRLCVQTRDDNKFSCAAVLGCVTSASMGAFIASFSGSVESAVATTIPVLQILVVFSDYFLDLNRLPFILYILPYLSPFYYGYSILNKLQWDNGSSSAVIYFDITMLFLLFTVFNILAFIVIWWGAHRFHIAKKWQTIIEKQTIN